MLLVGAVIAFLSLRGLLQSLRWAPDAIAEGKWEVPASLIFWRSCSPLEINARKSGVSGNQATHLFVTRKPMSLEDHVHGFTPHIVEFVRAHEMWAAPIFGALAFGESLAFISLVLPAWAVLVPALISGPSGSRAQ
jgi:hypothetical protein